MAKTYFDICTIDSVADLLGVQCKGGEAYKTLRPLHCVQWQQMPDELRREVPGLIQQCLGIEPQFQFKTARAEVIELVTPEPASPKRTGLLRLLGGGR
jgi:hypothetical protein